MYQLANFQPEVFKTLQIPNQKDIQNMTGFPMEPFRIYELIKSETNNFQESKPLALQGDKKLVAVYNRFKKGAAATAPDKATDLEEETMRIKEQERARSLKLLKLKLKLKAAS